MRALLACVVALLCGVYTACLVPAFIPKAFLFLTIVILLVASCFVKRARLPFLLILFFLCGAVHAGYKNDIKNRPLYPYADEYVTVTADVIREPVYHEEDGSHTLTVRVLDLSFLKEETAVINETALVKIKAGNPVPQFGQRFTAVCLFYEPVGTMNEGGFDYAQYLKSQNIFFRGKAENGTISLCGEAKLTVGDRFYALNRRAGNILEDIFPADSASVLKAMALGDSDGISDELREKLQISGLSHVISVSGMHISILISTLTALLGMFGGNRRRRNLVIFIVVLFYMFFAGASPAVVRAGVVALLSVVAGFVRRREDRLTSLAVAAGILVFINPMTAFDAGFLLSFAAALGITLFASPLCQLLGLQNREAKEPHFIKRAWVAVCRYGVVTLSAQVCLLPVAAYIFGYTSLWSFLTGLLVLPLDSLLMIGGMVVCIAGWIWPALSVLCAGFVYPFVWLFLQIVNYFGTCRDGLFIIGSLSAFRIFCYVLFLMVMERCLHKRWRQVIALGLSFGILLSAQAISYARREDLATVTFINVGQGDCALIRLPDGTNILIDGGGTPAYQGDYDVGSQVVLPYLRKAGIRKLDYVVATHPHEDHIRGLTSVLSKMPVETLLVPIGFDQLAAGRVFLSLAEEEAVAAEFLAAGDTLSFADGTALEVLMPDENWLKGTEEENDMSLVLRFCYGENEVLLTGDLEQDGEQYLVTHTEKSGADIMKVGHHGSANSTTKKLLDWAKPRYAYIPCGENNFGHPANETLDRLSAYNTEVFRADEDKDVCFVLSKTGVRMIKKGGDEK